MIVFLVRYAVFPFRGCSKSPIKMTLRISDVMLFRSSRIKCIRSGTGSYAASNFSVLFILLFEHALIKRFEGLFYERKKCTKSYFICFNMANINRNYVAYVNGECRYIDAESVFR